MLSNKFTKLASRCKGLTVNMLDGILIIIALKTTKRIKVNLMNHLFRLNSMGKVVPSIAS